MDLEERLSLVREVGEEIITEEDLKQLFEAKRRPVAYDGFEPSGKIHIAQGILRAINVNKMVKAGCSFKMWIADWHAWANNKMGGDFGKIQKAGDYMVEVWKASGMDTSKVKFFWASDVMGDKTYWEKVMKISINSTLNRVIRCSQIMGRKENEKIAALYSDNSIVVDFGALAEDFALKGEKNREDFKIKLGTKVVSISKVEGGYEISTDKGTVFAEKIVVAMCSHSLMFAKKMGYGKDFSILPVGGNYYTSQKKVLNGKVYTMQSGKLPFAAIHGDPNVHNEDETRFGPTANIMPFLERNNFSTLWDFVRSSVNDTKSFIALLRVVTDRLLFGFLLRSFVYAVPLAGTMAFVGLSRKIVPTLEYADFKKGRTKAGIRPQLVDNKTGKLVMGEAEIIGEDMIFHISPSPGATVCLSNAAKTVDKLMEFFEGKRVFDEELFKKDLSLK